MQSLIDEKKPHVIAICEVKPKKNSERLLQDYNIGDYSIYNTNLDISKGRGIFILVHSSIAHLTIQIDPPREFDEVCLLEIKLINSDTLLFGCFYRSPTENSLSDTNNFNLNLLMNQLASNNKYSHICFVGDFNFSKINWQNCSSPCSEDSKEENFLEALRDSYLYQHVLEPTRCRGFDEASTLDLIITNEEGQISKLEYNAPLGKSDHSTLSFDFDCYLGCATVKKRFEFNKANYALMIQELEETNFLDEYIQSANILTVEQCWEKLKKKIIDLRNRYVPVKQEGDTWRKGKIPINYELRSLIKNKKRLHRKWLNSLNKRTEDCTRKEYVEVRNMVNNQMARAKQQYELNISAESKRNPKRFWRHVRSYLKTRIGVSPLLSSPEDETSIRHEDKDKANILQDQFCSVFTKEPDGVLPHFASRTNKSIDMKLSIVKVRKEISALKSNKAIGPDEIHPDMLKQLIDYVTVPIFIIMSKSLNDGIVPKEWKLAHVSPIYKKGARNIAENYRPISLTSIVCRMMEKIMKNQLMDHLVNEKLLSTKQYGFINKRSTVMQLLHYLDTCAESVALGKVVDAIYFDFAKAFDTVPHRRLLHKLKAYGIDGKTLGWISSFLSDRYQTVKVNGVESKTCKVVSGVPQGSVLGPLLFVIYINDLPDLVNSNIYLFANDTKIVNRVDNIQDAMEIQNDINTLQLWSKIWLLHFHPGKCHVLTLGKFSNIQYAHQYSLGATILEHVSSEKDLGVIFDSNLNFEEHILSKIKKANSIVGLIRRSFLHLTPESFRQLYTSFVRPHLEYASSLWSPNLQKHINLIEGVQRRATKIVSLCKNLSYQERLQQINICTLKQRREMQDMIEVYKHLHHYDQAVVPNKLVARTRPSRKHQFELKRNFGHDGIRGVQTNSFYYRVTKPWNDLPHEVVNSPSLSIFKKRLEKTKQTF